MSRTLLSLAETTAAGNVKLQAAAAVHEGLRLICLCLHRTLTCLMSVCRHYDWGLRAIKSVLVVAGSLLRAQEGQVESDVLFRALRDFNIPKILSQDMVIFTGLLQDLFPAVDPPRKRDIEFEKVHIMLNAFCFFVHFSMLYWTEMWSKSWRLDITLTSLHVLLCGTTLQLCGP